MDTLPRSCLLLRELYSEEEEPEVPVARMRKSYGTSWPSLRITVDGVMVCGRGAVWEMEVSGMAPRRV